MFSVYVSPLVDVKFTTPLAALVMFPFNLEPLRCIMLYVNPDMFSLKTSSSTYTIPVNAGTAAKAADIVRKGRSNLPTSQVASSPVVRTLATVGDIGTPKTPDNCDKPTETTELSTCDHILNESQAHWLPDQAV